MSESDSNNNNNNNNEEGSLNTEEMANVTKQIIHAILSNDPGKVESILKSYKTTTEVHRLVNYKSGYNRNGVLHHACVVGNQDVLKLLLQNKANANYRNRSGETPLSILCKNHHLNCVHYFIETKNVDIQNPDNLGYTPLHLLMEQKPKGSDGIFSLIKIISKLKEKGYDINCENKEGDSPLHIASRYDNDIGIKILLDSNADIMHRNKEGKLPVEECTKENTVVLFGMGNNESVSAPISSRRATISFQSKKTSLQIKKTRSSTPKEIANKFEKNQVSNSSAGSSSGSKIGSGEAKSSKNYNYNTVKDFDFTFIVEERKTRASLFDAFSGKENITINTSLISTLNSEFDCIICPCETSYGPTWPKTSLTSSIMKKLGQEFSDKVNQYIIDNYLGEIPVGECFILKCEEKNCFVVVVALSINNFVVNNLYAFHGFRTALLRILNFKNPGNRSSLRAPVKKIQIPSVFESEKPKNNENEQSSSSPKVKRVSKNSIKTVIVPFFPLLGNIVDQEHPFLTVSTQLTRAYDSLDPTVFDPESLLTGDGISELLSDMEKPAEYNLKNFEKVLLDNSLSNRGFYDKNELNYLLDILATCENQELQQAAAINITQYLKIFKKSILPNDIGVGEVRDGLLNRKDRSCISSLLRYSEESIVSLHKVIEYSDVVVNDQIGTGATAIVYDGVYENQKVAVKVFVEGTDLREFRKEITMMTLLQHENLIRMFGAGINNNNPFIISELASRGCLYDILHDEKQAKMIALPTRVQWALDTAYGMEYLHDNGIIHRDLKTLNLLITEQNRCKITDYGAARLVDQNNNMTGNVGTCAWMAPEMFQSKNYTEKADVYSFAVCLLEIITGVEPFSDKTSFSIPVFVCKGGRPTIPKSVPKLIQKLIKECWNEKPSKRPSFAKIKSSLVHIQSKIAENKI